MNQTKGGKMYQIYAVNSSKGDNSFKVEEPEAVESIVREELALGATTITITRE